MIDVHVIWTHGRLTPLARLSLRSYRRWGYNTILHTYSAHSDVHEELERCAGAVRPAEEVWPWDLFQQHAFRPSAQLALACDQLAWRISQINGGWIGHLDVTLNRELPLQEPYVFGPHHRYRASMALWKAPAGSELVRRAIEAEIRVPPIDWHSNMRTFSDLIVELDLERFRRPDLVTDDADERPLRELMQRGGKLPDRWRELVAIHWCGSGTPGAMRPEDGSYFAELGAELPT